MSVVVGRPVASCDFLQQLQAVVHSGATIAVNAGPIGFVETGLKDNLLTVLCHEALASLLCHLHDQRLGLHHTWATAINSSGCPRADPVVADAYNVVRHRFSIRWYEPESW